MTKFCFESWTPGQNPEIAPLYILQYKVNVFVTFIDFTSNEMNLLKWNCFLSRTPESASDPRGELLVHVTTFTP